MGIIQSIYNASPLMFKKLMLNLEAIRRNHSRRYGNYKALKKEYRFEYYSTPYRFRLDQQNEAIKGILADTIKHVPYYYSFKKEVNGQTFGQLPVVTKNTLRKNSALFFHTKKSKRAFWAGKTSGSTGTPLQYYVEKSGIRKKYAILDNYYELFSCYYKEPRARIGGAKILDQTKNKPPYWLLNKVDNQLQLSAYHLNDNTALDYIKKLVAFSPEYITGYATSIYYLAKYFRQHNVVPMKLKAIFTDSEGITLTQRLMIEDVFGCPAVGDYGMAEIGLIAVLCREKEYHILDRSVKVEILDENDETLRRSETGRIIVTDLKQNGFPYIRYDTGDMGSIVLKSCDCGWEGLILKSIDGRRDEMIITPSGKKLTRLSYVIKPGKGIKESQIAQVSPDTIIIRVVPDEDFDPSSLKLVEKEIKEIIGNDMGYSFEMVEHIKRTNNHKFRYVVKEF